MDKFHCHFDEVVLVCLLHPAFAFCYFYQAMHALMVWSGGSQCAPLHPLLLCAFLCGAFLTPDFIILKEKKER